MEGSGSSESRRKIKPRLRAQACVRLRRSNLNRTVQKKEKKNKKANMRHDQDVPNVIRTAGNKRKRRPI